MASDRVPGRSILCITCAMERVLGHPGVPPVKPPRMVVKRPSLIIELRPRDLRLRELDR